MDDGEGFEAFSNLPQELMPCNICGRKFNPDAIVRHAPVCAKTAEKRRKVFNSSQQRAEGTEIKAVPKSTAPVKVVPRHQKQPPAKKSNWRAKHEEFIRNIRAARGVQAVIDAGGPLPPPPPPTINPDYVQCQFCERRFNESAAQRHIPFCEEQHKRRQVVAKQSKSKPQYKTPKLKGKTSTTSPSISNYGNSPAASGGRRVGGSSTSRPPAGRTGSGKSTSSKSGAVRASTMRSNHSNGSSHAYGDGNGSMSPGHGMALRTGRTAEGYSDARELSAQQKVQALSKKFPSSDSINKASYNRMEFFDDEDEAALIQTIGFNPRTTYKRSPRYTSYQSPSPPPSTLSSGRPPSGSRRSRGHESGYNSNSDDSRLSVNKHHKRTPSASARFCHECGTKYPVSSAKFCCECGLKRLVF